MNVLIGVDPQNASVAIAAVDEAKGDLLERASFPQDLEKAWGTSSAGRNDSQSGALSGGKRRWPLRFLRRRSGSLPEEVEEHSERGDYDDGGERLRRVAQRVDGEEDEHDSGRRDAE
jgi:hypothetical protein